MRVETGSPILTPKSLFWLEMKHAFNETSLGKGKNERARERARNRISKHIEISGSYKDKRKLVIIVGLL